MVDICKAVIPDAGEDLRFHIDMSHRIGRKESSKTRPLITRFTCRSIKEMVWKFAKDSGFLKAKKLKFREDLNTRRYATSCGCRSKRHISRGKKPSLLEPKPSLMGKKLECDR